MCASKREGFPHLVSKPCTCVQAANQLVLYRPLLSLLFFSSKLFAPYWHVLLLDVLLWFTSCTTHENTAHASLPCLLWIFRCHVACNYCSGSVNLQTAHNLKRPHTISHLEMAGLHPMNVHLPGIATSNNWQPKLHLVCYEVKTAGYGTRFRDDLPHFMLNIHKSSIKGFKASC